MQRISAMWRARVVKIGPVWYDACPYCKNVCLHEKILSMKPFSQIVGSSDRPSSKTQAIMTTLTSVKYPGITAYIELCFGWGKVSMRVLVWGSTYNFNVQRHVEVEGRRWTYFAL